MPVDIPYSRGRRRGRGRDNGGRGGCGIQSSVQVATVAMLAPVRQTGLYTIEQQRCPRGNRCFRRSQADQYLVAEYTVLLL